MACKNSVIIFGKYPRAGTVKTRLSPGLTPDQAAQIHLACLRCVCRQARALDTSYRVTLAGTPDEAGDAFEARLGGWSEQFQYRPQGTGDLGARLVRAFQAMFDDGANKVLAIGTDSPLHAVAAVPEAVRDLDHGDVVLGPAEDGGYYLVGLRKPFPEMFQGVAWGTGHVLRQTLERIGASGRDVKMLPLGYDLDRPQDVRRLMDDLADMSDNPSLLELRNTMNAILSDVPEWPGGSL